MIKRQDRKVNRSKRHRRVRVHVEGTKERPRLAVFRSLNHVYAQLIDDGLGNTVAAASTVEMKGAGRAQGAPQGKGNGVAQAAEVGKAIAAKAKAAGVSSVVFDRGGFLYHGRIKALADAAREAGLEF